MQDISYALRPLAYSIYKIYGNMVKDCPTKPQEEKKQNLKWRQTWRSFVNYKQI